MEEIKFIETLITMSDDTQNYWYGPRTRLTPHQDLQPQTLTLLSVTLRGKLTSACTARTFPK
jgi:hypothetical protein